MKDLPNFSRHGYQVKRRLWHNHSGARSTYLAISLRTGNLVIIKQFEFATPTANWSAYDAYHQEIEVLRGLNHRGIPKYLDTFETSAGLCLVQEYIHAPSLAKRRSFDATEIKQIAVSLLEILVYLQNRLPPIIHRDIKPENILVDDKINVYLIDFGFAKIGEGEISISSMVKGSIGFMPPEQLFNRHLSEASDLYSVGATLICLLTGTKSSAITNLIDENYCINFRHLVPKLSLRWIEWLEKMVELRPKDRFPNAAVALAALQPIYVIRTPEVKINQPNLDFQAHKLGEKISKSLTIINPIPETLLQGKWEVAPHSSDPPHNPDTHSWISFHPAKFETNHVPCQITIDTRHLMAGAIYERKILLHTNSLPETVVLNLKVQTAPIPVKTKTMPYICIALLLVISVVATWFEIGAWETIVTKFGSIGLFIAALVTAVVAAVGFATALVGKYIGNLVTQSVSQFKFLSKAVTALIAGLMAMFVASFAAEFRNISAAFEAVDVVVFILGYQLENLLTVSLNKGCSFRLTIALSSLIIAFGISLGIGWRFSFLNPSVLLAVLVFSLPLALILCYPSLQRARIITNYRHSQHRLIKP
ncbi:MAG: serine/threonine-protein kinase [Nostocaceae cyanobacterium]|nr:serine/threonine-protein kinase [Nostocaceae cyanobacterium]